MLVVLCCLGIVYHCTSHGQPIIPGATCCSMSVSQVLSIATAITLTFAMNRLIRRGAGGAGDTSCQLQLEVFFLNSYLFSSAQDPSRYWQRDDFLVFIFPLRLMLVLLL